MTKFEYRNLSCKCGNSKLIKCLAHRDYSEWRCASCAIKAKWADPEYRKSRQKAERQPKERKKRVRSRKSGLSREQISAKISESLKGRKLSESHKKSLSDKWKDPVYRERQLKRLRESAEQSAKKSRALWTKPEFRAKYQTPEFRETMAKVARELWKREEFRDKILATKASPEFKSKMAAIQASPEYIAKLSAAAASLPKVSSLQDRLYSILDDLQVRYYREYNDKPDDPECKVGPWSFDCVIPRDGRWLLIECNGDWVHSLEAKVRADKAKSTYINSYLSQKYELKTLWEHEFYNHNKVVETIKYWLGMERMEQVDFDFKDLVIKTAPASDYRPLLEKYHYLSNAGRGGIPYGAYYGDKLIAVCIFSVLPRQNITIQGHENCLDLSRLCIHPRYQKKNFASWFISRCIKDLPKKYTAIVSYADTTFNHVGSVYAASNFVLDKTIQPDYWYRSSDGWVMHKKTLYNRAVKCNLTEKEYAQRYNYIKVYGDVKLRYLYDRSKR